MIGSVTMEEEKWRLLEKAITKARVILDGFAVNEVFSTEEYVTNYEYPFLLFHSFGILLLALLYELIDSVLNFNYHLSLIF